MSQDTIAVGLSGVSGVLPPQCHSLDELAAAGLLISPPTGSPNQVSSARTCDLLELVRACRRTESRLLHRLEYHGMDVDPDVRTEAGSIIRKCEIALPHFRRGDALSAEDYPPGPFDLVVSTGLGEFLQRDELLTFYSHVHRVLRTGGVFFTSATARDRSSDLLLPMVELVTQYRSADDVRRILQRLPWREVRLTRESNGLQTFVVATK